MLIYSLRRLLEAIPVLLGVTVLTFLILHLAPGDPAQLIGGPTATAQEIANIRQRLQLDRPLYVQYGTFLWRLLHANLGESIQRRETVLSMLEVRLPNTAVLAVTSMLVTLLGIPLGVMAATRPNSVSDLLLMNVSLLGVSIPNFWLGILLIIWFSVDLGWFPVAGYHHPLLTLAGLESMVLPAITLGTGGMALVARLTRSGMLDVLGQDYVRTARAKGLPERAVLFRHALRNTMIPVVTVLGLNFGALLGGAVVTESVFAINGVGRLAVDSILARDYAVVQGSVVLIATTFVLVNLLVDLSYALLNPTIRYA
ncbi:MAG TPA: ABC transporter permease [Trueperaceae bacterium]|nr:ABC transporter permease [Trueperaceae bacterium]